MPEGPAGKACASLRVGNETRAWREGEVLFFDDSYEHEARQIGIESMNFGGFPSPFGLNFT